MTLPLRVGVRATQLWLRAAEHTVGLVVETAGRLISRDGEDEQPVWSESRYEVVEPPPVAPPAKPAPRAPEPYEPAPEPDPTPEPAHVSEEPVLVEEVAEAGAEDGAGASIHVEPPWDGYDQMNAADVADRVTGSSTAELAAIQLYETGTKGRRTVLEAVDRQLRTRAGSGS